MRPESLAEMIALTLAPAPTPPPTTAASPRGEIGAEIAQARAQILARAPQRAQPLFLKAWTDATEADFPDLAAAAAYGLALTLPRKSQIECLDRALATIGASTDPETAAWTGPLCLLRAWHSFDMHRYEEAIALFERALRTPFHPGENVDRAAYRWGIARSLRALDRVAEALDIQYGILAQMNARGDTNGHVFLEIGECLHLLRKPEAKSYYELAHGSLSTDPWYRDNRASELARMKGFFKPR